MIWPIAHSILSLWPLILMAAAALIFARPAGRLVFFLLGLAFFLAVWFVPWHSGLHGEGLWFAFPGLALCAAAMLAEAAVRAAGLLRRWRVRHA
ncbi:MAG TPA: hypothetical protein VGD66_02110 [Allosphingosinicella sp.]